MELGQYMLLDEFIMVPKEESIMSPNIEGNLNPFPDDFFLNPLNLNNPFDQTQDLHYMPNTTPPSLLELISPNSYNYPFHFTESLPFLDDLQSPEFSSFNEPLISSQDEFASSFENFEFFEKGINGFEDGVRSYNIENAQFGTPNIGIVGNVSACERMSNNAMKPERQTSKNLLAERRRRKRLNDRLSMLRSIVPKISKMDRTAILGDTIEYTKEILDKIQKFKEEGKNEKIKQINIGNCLKELKPNEKLARNSPKFDVERRNQDTVVEIYCTPKPGLLLSTLETLDALGLDIQHCVISCFNDFSLQASCYEIDENQSSVSTEEMKQALYRNAGYGGRCQ